MPMYLTKNFALKEMTKSSTAERLGLTNTPTMEHVINLVNLCNHILQTIRVKRRILSHPEHPIQTLLTGLMTTLILTSLFLSFMMVKIHTVDGCIVRIEKMEPIVIKQ